MEHPRDRDIIEQIVTELGRPLRDSKTQAKARAGAETAIAMLRMGASLPFPDVDAIKKIKRQLHKALEPFDDGKQIPIWCGDRHMTMRDFRSALDWFEGLNGPSSKVDIPKHLAAIGADSFVNEFSQNPPTGKPDGQVSEIASLLYQALTGKKEVRLKHQIDSARVGWRGLELYRGR